MIKHLLVDLDGCLLETSQAQDYLNTREGREFISRNSGEVETSLMNLELSQIVQEYSKNRRVSILTNSPKDYAREMLRKHRFSSDIEVYGSSNKPSSNVARDILRNKNLEPDEVLLIGDSVIDILSAHPLKIPNIATIGGYSFLEQLEKAGPGKILEGSASLEDFFIEYEKGNWKYSERIISDHITCLDDLDINLASTQFKFFSLGEYTPWNRGGRMDFHSDRILRFKEAKKYSKEELNKGARRRFFYNNSFGVSSSYGEIFFSFLEKAEQILNRYFDERELFLVSAPNSFPEFSYRSDINEMFIGHLCQRNKNFHKFEERIFYRVYPKEESHLNGRVGENHFSTLGALPIPLDYIDFGGVEDVIIFDDVFKTGNQIGSLASVLNHFEIGKNYYGLVLGKVR